MPDAPDGLVAPTGAPSATVPSGAPTATYLHEWGAAMDRALQQGAPLAAATLARVVLIHLPRHLATYQRILRAAWMLKRWGEGEDWGRRLLQADPNHPLAWRAVARALEERSQRKEARAVWQRAFETDPYAPDMRAGLVRTTVRTPEPLALNRACLAALYLHGYRWAHAAALYRSLIESDPRRIDFQVGLMVALWRQGDDRSAYRLARYLVRAHPHLLMAWLVAAALGDDNDRALAANPIRSMDPDGEFARGWLRLELAPRPERGVARHLPAPPVTLHVTAEEMALLQDTDRIQSFPDK